MIGLGSDKNGNCMTQLKLYVVDKLSSPIFCYHPTKSPFFQYIQAKKPIAEPLLNHLIPSNTNLYWPCTSEYRHILTQNHQVLLISHHLVRHSSDKWIISLFYDSFMSHARYTRSSSDSLLKGDRKRTFRALQAFPFTTSRVLRKAT